ncbi:MAG: hypothetical protein IKD22_06605, partial [Lentisphaeria bacterium]|nr:hypothetical protein [Lentisphaeria bacterium]
MVIACGEMNVLIAAFHSVQQSLLPRHCPITITVKIGKNDHLTEPSTLQYKIIILRDNIASSPSFFHRPAKTFSDKSGDLQQKIAFFV